MLENEARHAQRHERPAPHKGTEFGLVSWNHKKDYHQKHSSDHEHYSGKGN
jgi:hypothetical protein